MKRHHLKRKKKSHRPREDTCNTNPEKGSVSRIYKKKTEIKKKVNQLKSGKKT